MKILKSHLIVVFALVLLTFSFASAQTSPKLEWQHCYGGSWDEGGTAISDAEAPKDHTLIRTSDGGYAFLGLTDSDDGDVSGNHNRTEDFWLVKIDHQGNIQWQRCFGGTRAECPKCLIQTSDGGYAICGWALSHDGDVTDPYRDSVLVNLTNGATDHPTTGWIVKTDSLGVKQWARNIGPFTVYHEEYLSVVEMPDGFIIAGISDGSDEDWHTHSARTDSTFHIIYRPWDALVLKLDRNGNHQWHRLLGGSGHEEARCILPCSDGGYIFAGKAWSPDTDVVTGQLDDVRGIHVPDPYHIRSDVWVVRIDSLARIVWQHCYGGTDHESATCMIKTPEGYMIAATALSNDGDVTGNHGGQDAWIFTIDTNGKLLNQRCFGGDSTDFISSIVRMSDGNYAFAGMTISTDGDVSGIHRGVQDSTDGWVGEFSPELKLLWQRCLGGTGNEIFGTVIETADGGVMLNGTTNSNNGDASGLHPCTDPRFAMSDVWNVKLASPYASVESTPVGAGFTNPYPNPAQEEVDLELFHNNSVNKIEFYDLLAHAVFPQFHVEGTTAIVDVKNIPNGVYMMKVTYETGSPQVRKFVRAGF